MFVRHVRRWTATMLSALCVGCASVGPNFIVDVSVSDPVIYPPGVVPDEELLVALDGLSLGTCGHGTIALPAMPPDQREINLRVSSRLWVDDQGMRRTTVVQVPPEEARLLAHRDIGSLHEALLQALGSSPVDLRRPVAPSKRAAEDAAYRVQMALPRPYSRILRTAYNHRVWNKTPGADGDRKADATELATAFAISLDLLPGMRLRVDSSIPIAPSGIFSNGEHPSSFAAPTYIYFHAFSAHEMCDPGAQATDWSSTHICRNAATASTDEQAFVSASGGLARLGMRQYRTFVKPFPDDPAVFGASSPIDLFERANIGEGAWRYWRLWMPVQRFTQPSKKLGSGDNTSAGSPEESDSLPLLIAASTLEDLAGLNYGADRPCGTKSGLKPYRCHALHYRAVPVAEFMVHVNGQPRWVAVGTTLADMLADQLQDGMSARSYFFSSGTDAAQVLEASAFAGVTARRVLGRVTVRRLEAGRARGVVPNTMNTQEDAQRFLRLQLVPGDELTWR